MKLTIWIRRTPDDQAVTLRTDIKYESLDTPTVQNFGRKLLAAIESCGEKGSGND